MSKSSTPFDLSGETALITGGARGIGQAIARGLGHQGAQVVIADIDEPGGLAAARALVSEGISAIFVETDVTNGASVEAARNAAYERFGTLDVLVNNAAMSQRTPAAEYSDFDLDRMVDLNLKGVFRCMQVVAHRWIAERHPGRIINLASFAGVVADPLSAPYAATKGAVVQLTRTCAVEWAPYGIRVNAIGPGYTRTPMTEPALGDPDTLRTILAKTPLGRVAEPEDLAGAAIFLATRSSAYVTGHILMVDGGWTAL
jgi:NAD(P)-dependent dehydrogenase (short-subunit alcohol dehydrogenase family)